MNDVTEGGRAMNVATVEHLLDENRRLREALREVLDAVYCGCAEGGRNLVTLNFCLVHGWRAKNAHALLARED